MQQTAELYLQPIVRLAAKCCKAHYMRISASIGYEPCSYREKNQVSVSVCDSYAGILQ